jgi:hypothetical protein
MKTGPSRSPPTLRVHGSRGEGERFSFFEKAHQVQLLTAEYTGPLVGLILAHVVFSPAQPLRPVVRWLMRLAVVMRFVFALRMLDFKVDKSGYLAAGPLGNPRHLHKLSAFGVVGANGSYAAYLGLIVTLLGK